MISSAFRGSATTSLVKAIVLTVTPQQALLANADKLFQQVETQKSSKIWILSEGPNGPEANLKSILDLPDAAKAAASTLITKWGDRKMFLCGEQTEGGNFDVWALVKPNLAWMAKDC